ncbi:MAG TPA: HlyD family efflux transporter periplasmic adaptor subunit [Burkholderiales bacterium]|nr:HlyD family efflux transporter periplasmic adaptor subunit [Burkholderiales bacterium]
MSDELHSTSWYRVAGLRPRLRSHVRIHRHTYRGERWYVLEDRVSRRVYRFDPVSHYVIGLMDGYRTVQEIWDSAMERFGDEAPSQDETIRLLGQLHMADVLQSAVTPDVAELLRRARRTRKKTWMQMLLSPMAVKIPLFDPDRMLDRWLPWYRPLFGWGAALVWCVVIGAAISSAAVHWSELTNDLTDRVLAPQNVLLLFLTFPVVKLCHEFGHACATKAWGGEVHEMGIMLLVLMPIPYVDATSASAFRETHRRVVVGAAGMMVELFLASIALYLWTETQPGVTRAVLYNVMLIAGVSTVVFNGNPLLRYDGYYILCDLIQIPNLRQRSQQYLGHVVETRLFGVRLREVEATRSERRWFVFFAIASFFYRNFVFLAIALFIAGKYFFVGVGLALWTVFGAVIMPLGRGLHYLLFHSRLRRHRNRALMASGAALGALAALLFLLPVPLWSTAEGVIWAPEDAQVHAGTDGFVTRVVAIPGSFVRRGRILIEAQDPELPTRIRYLEAQVRLLESRLRAARVIDRVQWELVQEELTSARAELAHAKQREAELTIVSPADGVFQLAVAQDLPERYVHKGEQLGYVVPAAAATARVLVSQDDIDLVRSRTQRVRVKVAGRLYDSYEAVIRREVPAGSNRLPNMALSSAVGGKVAIDPRERNEPKALQKWFEFELALPEMPVGPIGERVYVRFEHGSEPIAWRLHRSIRQLFMKRFTV